MIFWIFFTFDDWQRKKLRPRVCLYIQFYQKYLYFINLGTNHLLTKKKKKCKCYQVIWKEIELVSENVVNRNCLNKSTKKLMIHYLKCVLKLLFEWRSLIVISPHTSPHSCNRVEWTMYIFQFKLLIIELRTCPIYCYSWPFYFTSSQRTGVIVAVEPEPNYCKIEIKTDLSESLACCSVCSMLGEGASPRKCRTLRVWACSAKINKRKDLQRRN